MNLSSYRSPKTEVRKSKIDKYGRFARTAINKGEIIVIRSGHIITSQELESNENIINGSEHQILDDYYLAPLTKEEFDNIMCFINHSCVPNVGIQGDIVLIATKNIKTNEELCLDYAMIFNNKKFKCHCLSKNCRKVITGKDWMRKDLQVKYKDYFSSYLLQKIKNQ